MRRRRCWVKSVFRKSFGRKMDMKKLIQYFAAVLFVFIISSSASAETLFVKAREAKVMPGASFAGQPIGKLAAGSKVESLSRKGSWVEVEFEGRRGYLAATLLTDSPPSEGGFFSRISDKVQSMGGARRRASTYTSAAAARGVMSFDRARMSRQEMVNYDALSKMESSAPSEDDVARFIEEGRK